ncbi:MAG: hypothetical protein KKA62_04980 [Nanoarchaeota archaeon]|nr:hypothetical protein [Nanoarchaeota archaeon]MBU1643709.1 hypothetical protein [Nanoarchaeota archaeon]MBU1977275.1 hypothetical protein [Nanoarchaeota archaeon]
MVGVEGLGSTLTMLIALFATLAAIAGIVVLEGFFRDKLKELFSDSNYFIFFFLVSGYVLYSIGELSYYLTDVIFENQAPVGIADVYWTGGAIFILISFIALTINLFRLHFNSIKLTTMFFIGLALVISVLILLFGVFIDQEATFFSYFYPIASSLIVTFALSTILFSLQLEDFGADLKFFFLASCGILLGDILFSYVTTTGIDGLPGMISDLSYLFGYGLSLVAFIMLRLRMHRLTI